MTHPSGRQARRGQHAISWRSRTHAAVIKTIFYFYAEGTQLVAYRDARAGAVALSRPSIARVGGRGIDCAGPSRGITVGALGARPRARLAAAGLGQRSDGVGVEATPLRGASRSK